MPQQRQRVESEWFGVPKRLLLSLFYAGLLVLSASHYTDAQINFELNGPIIDDFEDGNYSDGSPTSWTPTDPKPWETHNIVNGDFIINRPLGWRGFEDPDKDNVQYAELAETMLRDVSTRVQARMLARQGKEGRDEFSAVSLAVRICHDGFLLGVCGDPVPPPGDNYTYIDFHWNGEVHTAQNIATRTEKVVATDILPLEEDVVLQVDAFGEDLKFWVWRPGEPRPDEPIIEYTAEEDPNKIIGGVMFGSVYSKNAFRYVHVAESPIVDLPGDFNSDWTLTVDDVDRLMTAIRTGESVPLMDLDTNDLVDQEDLQIWVKDLRNTWFGDADLNGEVEFADFLALSDNFGQDGGWSQGDFDGSGDVQFADFLLLSSNFGNVREATIIQSVPEPNGFAVALVCCLFLIRGRKQL